MILSPDVDTIRDARAGFQTGCASSLALLGLPATVSTKKRSASQKLCRLSAYPLPPALRRRTPPSCGRIGMRS